MGRGNIVGMNKQGENALEILALKNTKYIFKPAVINNVVSLKAYHKDKQNSCRIYAGSPQKKWSSHHGQQKSLKCSTWMQSQK